MNNVRLFGVKIASRTQRRGLVIFLYGSFVAMGMAFPASRLLAAVPALLCMAAYWGVHQVTRRYALAEVNAAQGIADAREAAVRHTATARAYQVVSSLFLLLTGFMAAVGTEPTHKQWNYIFVGTLLLTATLPQALIAWSEPDIPYAK